MAYHVDFHTHSIASPDGSLKDRDYEWAFENKLLHAVAVTDHNTISKAQDLRKKYGKRIIVGEEITTSDGEIIGLFLTEEIPASLTAEETVKRIKQQGGLVYIPHPFETVRKGISIAALNKIAKDVDIIEAYNGRAIFQNRTRDALAWSREFAVPAAASSDSHGRAGWGKTYTTLSALPTKKNLVDLLKEAQHNHTWPGVRGMLYPKLNRLRKVGGKRG